MPKKQTTVKEVDYKNAFVPLAGEEDVMIPKKVLEITKKGIHRTINTLTNKGNLRKVNKNYVVHLVPSDSFISKKSIKSKSTSLIKEIYNKSKTRYYNESKKLHDEVNDLIKIKNSARGNRRKELQKQVDDLYLKIDKANANWHTQVNDKYHNDHGINKFNNENRTFFV